MRRLRLALHVEVLALRLLHGMGEPNEGETLQMILRLAQELEPIERVLLQRREQNLARLGLEEHAAAEGRTRRLVNASEYHGHEVAPLPAHEPLQTFSGDKAAMNAARSCCLGRAKGVITVHGSDDTSEARVLPVVGERLVS